MENDVEWRRIAFRSFLNDDWFCRNAAEVAVDYGWIARGWMMSFNGLMQKGMMEFGRGGACVPARVAPQGRIHHSFPCTMRVFLVWKRRCADVRAGTQAPPLPFQHVQASCEPETKRFFARRNAASTKPFGNSFAGTLRAFEKVE